MKNLTLTQETTIASETLFIVRLDGTILKCFGLDDEDEARRFFSGYRLPSAESVKILSERFIDGEFAEDTGGPKPWIHGNIIMNYRGAVITDKPYKFNDHSPSWEPFTIVIAGRVWDHSDEETLEEVLDTIDIILEESKLDVEPMPEWRVKETERRIAKSKERAADREEINEEIKRLNLVIASMEAQP